MSVLTKNKLIKLIVLLIMAIVTIGIISINIPDLGTRPDSKMKTSFETSDQFSITDGVFQNKNINAIPDMKKRIKYWDLITELFSSGVDKTPNKILPEVKPDLEEFLKRSTDLKVIWFGHSSFLLNMDGKIIFVDPVFGESAAPFSFIVKRFQAPVLNLDELPAIDYIVISHDHYDHLDLPSIKYFAKKNVKFITPLGVGSHLIGWGVDKAKIIEKDWWETASFDGIDFTATPAQHFSGRDGLHDNVTLWASWVFKSTNHNIYFSGDSGYASHFKEIGDRLGPFDVAFMESGQYDQRWREVHMLPKEAVIAFKELNANKYFPIHWGMFELSFHRWYDPIVTLFKLSKSEGFSLVTPKIGQIINLSKENKVEKWWERII